MMLWLGKKIQVLFSLQINLIMSYLFKGRK